MFSFSDCSFTSRGIRALNALTLLTLTIADAGGWKWAALMCMRFRPGCSHSWKQQPLSLMASRFRVRRQQGVVVPTTACKQGANWSKYAWKVHTRVCKCRRKRQTSLVCLVLFFFLVRFSSDGWCLHQRRPQQQTTEWYFYYDMETLLVLIILKAWPGLCRIAFAFWATALLSHDTASDVCWVSEWVILWGRSSGTAGGHQEKRDRTTTKCFGIFQHQQCVAEEAPSEKERRLFTTADCGRRPTSELQANYRLELHDWEQFYIF